MQISEWNIFHFITFFVMETYHEQLRTKYYINTKYFLNDTNELYNS